MGANDRILQKEDPLMYRFSIRTPVRCVVIPLAALAVLMLLAWYFVQPLAFPTLAQQGVEQVNVVADHYLGPAPFDPENFSGLPQFETRGYTFSPDSPEIQTVERVLDFRSYHRSWGTITDTRSYRGVGDWDVYLTGLDAQGRQVWSVHFTGGETVFVNDRAYQVGWWGGGAGEALTEELAEVLHLT